MWHWIGCSENLTLFHLVQKGGGWGEGQKSKSWKFFWGRKRYRGENILNMNAVEDIICLAMQSKHEHILKQMPFPIFTWRSVEGSFWREQKEGEGGCQPSRYFMEERKLYHGILVNLPHKCDIICFYSEGSKVGLYFFQYT